MLSNTICPYLIFTLLTLEGKETEEGRREEGRREERREERGGKEGTLLANKQNSSWKSLDFKRESYTKQI